MSPVQWGYSPPYSSHVSEGRSGNRAAFFFCNAGVGCAPSERRPHLNITNDFFPGAIGQIIQMHGTHYAKHWGFTSYFEAKVAHQIAKFTLDK